jgi:hypothetical protein
MYTFDTTTSAFKGQLKDRRWVGAHTIVIEALVGANGVYGSFSTDLITLTVKDPCDSTVLEEALNTHSILTPLQTGIRKSASQTVLAQQRVYWMYEEVIDSYSKQFPDVMYDICGPRTHTVTVKDSSGNQNFEQGVN